ncbi:MAG: 2'-5' RNA ligase family protein, partial [Solirubrobacteraceae bacterium]
MALELPADVRQTLAAWAAAVANDQGALRPVREESLHVTLCFLG